jgi:hypothetical protein
MSSMKWSCSPSMGILRTEDEKEAQIQSTIEQVEILKINIQMTESQINKY